MNDNSKKLKNLLIELELLTEEQLKYRNYLRKIAYEIDSEGGPISTDGLPKVI